MAFHQGARPVFVAFGDGVHDEAVVLEAAVELGRKRTTAEYSRRRTLCLSVDACSEAY